MSPDTALHEAGHIVLAETFGYLTLAYYLGGQTVSLYYFDEERFIRGIAPPLCVIGMGGYVAELLFSDSVDLAGCAYDFERVTATYDEPFVSSLLPEQSVGVKDIVPKLAASCDKSGARAPNSGLESCSSGTFFSKMYSLRQTARSGSHPGKR